MEPEQRERAESGKSTPIEDCDIFGCEEVMDLSFRACKLQVQITVKGQYQNPSDLMKKYWNLASYIWQKVVSQTWRDLPNGISRDPNSTTSTYGLVSIGKYLIRRIDTHDRIICFHLMFNSRNHVKCP